MKPTLEMSIKELNRIVKETGAIVMSEAPEIKTEVLLKDVPLGCKVEFDDGHCGTVIGQDAHNVLVGYETKAVQSWSFDSSIGQGVLKTRQQSPGFAIDTAKYPFAWWYALNDKVKQITFPKQAQASLQEIELEKAPIGSEIEFEDGEKATVVGRQHTSAGGELSAVLLAWKDASHSRKHHPSSYFKPVDGISPSPAIQHWLDTAYRTRPAEITSDFGEYELARWYSQELKTTVKVTSHPSNVSIITNKHLFEPKVEAQSVMTNTKNLCDLPIGTKIAIGLEKGTIERKCGATLTNPIDVHISWENGSRSTIKRNDTLATPTVFSVESIPDTSNMVALNTLPLGTEVEFFGHKGTVVGRASNGDTLLGTQDGEKPVGWHLPLGKIQGDEYIDGIDQYKWFSWKAATSNHQCRVIKEVAKESDQYTTDLRDVPLGSVVEFQSSTSKETIRGTVVGLYKTRRTDEQRITKPDQIAIAFRTAPQSMGTYSIGSSLLNEPSLAIDIAHGHDYELAPNYKDFFVGCWTSNRKVKVVSRGNGTYIKPSEYSTKLDDIPIGSEIEFKQGEKTVRATVICRYKAGHNDNVNRVKPTHIALAFKSKSDVPSELVASRIGKDTITDVNLNAYPTSYELAPNYKDFECAVWKTQGDLVSFKCKITKRGNDAYIKPVKQNKISRENALELANLAVKIGGLSEKDIAIYADGVEKTWTKEQYDRVYADFKAKIAAQYDTKLSDVRVGDEVEFDNGFVATVIGRSLTGSRIPFLGWNNDQSNVPFTPFRWHNAPTTKKRLENKDPHYDFVPDALKYQNISGWNLNPNAKVKVKAKSMTNKQTQLQDLALGTVVNYPYANGDTATVVGKDGSGYVCLGSSTKFPGSFQQDTGNRSRFASGKSIADVETKYPYTRWYYPNDFVTVVSSSDNQTAFSDDEVYEVIKDSLFLGIIRPSEVAEETKRIRQGSREDLLALKQVIKEAKEDEQKFFDQSLKQAQNWLGSMAPTVQVHRMNMDEFKKLVDKLNTTSGNRGGVISDELVDQMASELQKIWEETTQPPQTQQQVEASMGPMPVVEKTYTLSQLKMGDEVQCQDQYGIPVCGAIVGEHQGYYALASNTKSASDDARDTSFPAVRKLIEEDCPETFASNTFRYKHFTWVPKSKQGCLLLRPSAIPFHSIADAKREEQAKLQTQVNQESQKENTMNNTQEMSKPSFWDTMKSEGKEAGWRIASTQIVKAAKTGVLAALRSKGTGDGKLAAIAEFLDSEIGNAMIAGSLGHILPHLPGSMGKDPRVQKIAKEFRVQGYATAGNELVGTAMEHILPAITTALQALPKEETETKTRVHHEETGSEENEEQEEVSNGKKASA